MQYRIQALFDIAVMASHPAVMKSIISYLDRRMIPGGYKKPELLPEEICHVLNNSTGRYRIVNSAPDYLDRQQLYLDFQMEKSDEMGVSYFHGRFQVFAASMNAPVLEDVFNIIVSQGSQLEALNRQVCLNGEIIACKLYPCSKKQLAASNHSNRPQLSMVNG